MDTYQDRFDLTKRIYCASDAFLTRMQVCINEIQEKSEGALSFVEYITLPHFGNAILRFDIKKENYTLEDLDRYEAFMQGITGDEFLVDFMGSVYQAVGFEPRMQDEKFRKCYHLYEDVLIAPTNYHMELKQDAALLLKKCGLSSEWKVWEIHIEEEITLLVLGGANRRIGTYALEDCTIQVYEVEEMPCVGLMRAILHAKLQHISLVRVLLET